MKPTPLPLPFFADTDADLGCGSGSSCADGQDKHDGQPPRVALVGAGRMGSALLEGWHRFWPDHPVLVRASRLSSSRAGVLPPGVIPWIWPRSGSGSGTGTGTGSDATDSANNWPDVVVVATKPQDVASAIVQVRDHWPAHRPLPTLVSVCAGVEWSTMAPLWCRADVPSSESTTVVRAMPNLAVRCGQGVIGIYGPHPVPVVVRHLVNAAFSPLGAAVWLDNETLLHAVTAVSGSGPAYVYLLAQAMLEAATAQGISSEIATILVGQTLLGAAHDITGATSAEDLAQMRSQVTSPGGTTAAALGVLMSQDGGLSNLMTQAVAAATERSRQIAQTIAPTAGTAGTAGTAAS